MDDRLSLADQPQHERGGIGYYARNKVTSMKGIFSLAAARPIVSDEVRMMVDDQGAAWYRCDRDYYGPMGFHEFDPVAGVCNCGATEPPHPTTGNHVINFNDIEFIDTVADFLPYGYIVYMECRTPEIEEAATRMRHTSIARSLQEVFRLMLEWDYAYTALGNRELIAETCHNMLSVAPIPQDIQDWLLAAVPEQKVARFLRGEPDAQGRDPDIPDMSADFDNWVTGVILNSHYLAYVPVNPSV